MSVQKNLLAVICIHLAKSKISPSGIRTVYKGFSCSLSKNFLGLSCHQILKPTSYHKLCAPAIFLQRVVNLKLQNLDWIQWHIFIKSFAKTCLLFHK